MKRRGFILNELPVVETDCPRFSPMPSSVSDAKTDAYLVRRSLAGDGEVIVRR